MTQPKHPDRDLKLIEIPEREQTEPKGPVGPEQSEPRQEPPRFSSTSDHFRTFTLTTDGDSLRVTIFGEEVVNTSVSALFEDGARFLARSLVRKLESRRKVS